MTVKKPEELLDLKEGDIIDSKNYFNLIKQSKQLDWAYYNENLIIGNTPQQGINWIGPKLTNQTYNCLNAVLVRAMKNSDYDDDWNAEGSFNNCFRLDKGIINYQIQPNMVLIQQARFKYPVCLFEQNGNNNELIFRGKFNVTKRITETKRPYVILEKVIR